MSDLMNLKEAIVNGKLEEAKAIVNEVLSMPADKYSCYWQKHLS